MNGSLMRKPERIRPFCLCGCEQRVRVARNRYIDGHVPHAIRADAGRKGGMARIYRRRCRQFEQVFAEMTREGQRITKSTLLDALAVSFRDGYRMGYRACEGKWKRRALREERVA